MDYIEADVSEERSNLPPYLMPSLDFFESYEYFPTTIIDEKPVILFLILEITRSAYF